MRCRFCGEQCVRDGLQADGSQRYKCKHCHKRQQGRYRYNAYGRDIDTQIVALTKIGVGVRDIAKFIHISATTVLIRIHRIAKRIAPPSIPMGHIYEVDEMWSYIRTKRKPIWIAYALDRKTKQVVSFNVGNRSKEMLAPILETLNDSQAKRIYTDNLQHYKSLIPETVHRYTNCGTNRIERNNLNLRTHLKRLNRRTICFSRSAEILTAILKIYFWG